MIFMARISYRLEPIGAGVKIADPDKFVKLANRVLDDFAKEVTTELESTVATWDTQVGFETESTDESREVFTDSEVYKFVDEGTSPHVIKATTGSGLSFPTGFVSKTVPGVIGSRSGGKFGDFVQPPPMSVHHPGTEARDFTGLIQKEKQEKFEKAVIEAMESST